MKKIKHPSHVKNDPIGYLLLTIIKLMLIYREHCKADPVFDVVIVPTAVWARNGIRVL